MRGRRKVINSNFSAGELDPRLTPLRSDIQAWQQGCKRLANMRPLLHGGVTTRPGTDFKVILASDAALIPFEFSETQGYVLALKASVIDIFYQDGSYATSVAMPWTLDQAKHLRFAQSGDTMFLCHKEVAIQKLVRTGAATFTLTGFDFAMDPLVNGRKLCPFVHYAPAAMTITPSAVTGNGITLTVSSAYWVAAHVGLRVRIGGKQTQITSITSPTVAVANVAAEVLPGITATTDWDEEAFSLIHGYPQAVCFHNERLVFGGSLYRPSGIWASQVGDFANFDIADSTDDKAIWIGIGADKVVEVLHLCSFQFLTVFTDQVELYQPEGDSQPWSPKTAAFRQQTAFGCDARVRPARFDDAILFVQKYGHQVREYLYNSTAQAYSSDAVSIMNPGLIENAVAIAGVTASRDVDEQYAFVVVANGNMAVLHSLRAQRVTAWAQWITDGAFRDVCSVNGKVFVVVERTIQGAQRFHLEMLNYSHAMDCATQQPVSVGANSIGGLSYLRGKLVQVVNNGYAFAPNIVTPDDFYVAIDDYFTHPSALVGLPFGTILESMPPEIQVDDGSSRGRPLRVVKAGIQVFESIRLVVSGEGANITNINDDFSVPPNPKTGMYDFILLGFDSSGRTVVVTCDVPIPLTVLGMALEVVV